MSNTCNSHHSHKRTHRATSVRVSPATYMALKVSALHLLYRISYSQALFFFFVSYFFAHLDVMLFAACKQWRACWFFSLFSFLFSPFHVMLYTRYSIRRSNKRQACSFFLFFFPTFPPPYSRCLTWCCTRCSNNGGRVCVRGVADPIARSVSSSLSFFFTKEREEIPTFLIMCLVFIRGGPCLFPCFFSQKKVGSTYGMPSGDSMAGALFAGWLWDCSASARTRTQVRGERERARALFGSFHNGGSRAS